MCTCACLCVFMYVWNGITELYQFHINIIRATYDLLPLNTNEQFTVWNNGNVQTNVCTLKFESIVTYPFLEVLFYLPVSSLCYSFKKDASQKYFRLMKKKSVSEKYMEQRKKGKRMSSHKLVLTVNSFPHEFILNWN